MNNPYANRGAIKNPQESYGREKEIRRIYSRISSSHPQCLSIIGERKIGKSSLLYYISHKEVLKKWLKDADSYLFLLIDLQERVNGLSFLTFFQFIFKMLSDRVGASLVPSSLIESLKTETDCYETFKKIVLDIDKQGFKLILLFDEFGMITRNEHFDAAFFSFLRSIANNHECAYITTSRERLQKLCHNVDISESPFFNIFTPVPLGQFAKDEARSLIFGPSEKAGVPFDEADADFVFSVAGRHPLFIQMACAALFEPKSRNGAASAKGGFETRPYEAVKADFLVEANEQFDYIWQDADEGERQLLTQIAIGGEITSQQNYLIRDLQRKGYMTNDDPPMIFSQAFQEFVVAKNPNVDIGKGPSRTTAQPVKRPSFLSRIAGILKRKA